MTTTTPQPTLPALAALAAFVPHPEKAAVLRRHFTVAHRHMGSGPSAPLVFQVEFGAVLRVRDVTVAADGASVHCTCHADYVPAPRTCVHLEAVADLVASRPDLAAQLVREARA